MRNAADAKTHFPNEAALCAAFVREFNAIDGWTCYPETGGFDILVAHVDGRQIGVEAKMQLNAKVVDQILPRFATYYDECGPDYRLVIVPYISDGAAGIAKMLRMLGVDTWEAQSNPDRYSGLFHIDTKIHQGTGQHYWDPARFDWNPAQRIKLPDTVPEVPAGVPSPVRLTPWKQGALRVLAHLHIHRRITVKQIHGYGIDSTMWTRHGWLDRDAERGWWVEALDCPRRHAKQNPQAYAAALEYVRNRRE